MADQTRDTKVDNTGTAKFEDGLHAEKGDVSTTGVICTAEDVSTIRGKMVGSAHGVEVTDTLYHVILWHFRTTESVARPIFTFFLS